MNTVANEAATLHKLTPESVTLHNEILGVGGLSVWTDGSSRKHPLVDKGFVGGWGSLVYEGNKPVKAWSEYDLGPNTTAGKMELLAAVAALEYIVQNYKGGVCYLCSDSQYVLYGIGRLPGWISNGWKVNSGAPVKNKELWVRFLALDFEAVEIELELVWVKGHKDNYMTPNHHADTLATKASSKALLEVDDVPY